MKYLFQIEFDSSRWAHSSVESIQPKTVPCHCHYLTLWASPSLAIVDLTTGRTSETCPRVADQVADPLVLRRPIGQLC